jgi:hypothetical protein
MQCRAESKGKLLETKLRRSRKSKEVFCFVVQEEKQGCLRGLGEGTVWVRWKQYADERSVPSFSSPNVFGTFGTKSTEILCQKH